MSDISLNARTRPEAVIADEHVAVEPGQMAQTTMTVRNTGSEIAEYAVSMVPDSVPGPWMEAVPDTIRLLPGREQEVVLRFQPPHDTSTDAGTFPYGVRIEPDEVEHQAQVVVEGDVSVGAIHALAVSVKPRLSKGRWRGKHVLTLENRGTEDTRVKLQAIDEDDALSLALAPTSLTVPARSAAEAFLRVRPRSPSVMGKPIEHPFQVTYRRRVDAASSSTLASGGELEASVSGSFRHKPILSPLVIVLGLLLIAVVALLLVLRPWETEDPRRPPEPPGVAAFGRDTSVVVGWENAPNVDEVLIREVDCTTADHVIPTAVGEETSVIPTGSGRQTVEVGPFELGEEHCFQGRTVSTEGRSVWFPSPAERVTIGSPIPAPEVTAEAANCGVTVDWPDVEVGDDGAEVTYVVSINDQPQDPPVTGSPQTFADQAPGETVRVFVRAMVGEQAGPPSETVEVPIPADCTAGENGENGEDGEEVVDLRGGQVFLVISPVETTDAIVTTWQAIAVDAGLPRLPADGVVGETVLLPENPAQAFDERRVIYLNGYVQQEGQPLAEVEAAARADCALLNREVDKIEDPALQVCRLVKADGTVEPVAPAPEEGGG